MYGEVQGLNYDTELATEYLGTSRPTMFPIVCQVHRVLLFVCPCFCPCCAFYLEYPSPFFLTGWDLGAPSLRSLPHPLRHRLIPTPCSPDHRHPLFHLHTYHTELQLFTPLAPSLGCEFPEVSNFVFFLFLFRVSRMTLVHLGLVIPVLNGCMRAWEC